MLPSTLAEIQARLQALTLYGSDIFVADDKGNIPLWTKHSGLNPTGLDHLIEISKRYYDRRRQERTLNKGDRVALIGRGIAVVEQADDGLVHVLLRNWIMLRIARREIRWDQRNMRWEAAVSAPLGLPSAIRDLSP